MHHDFLLGLADLSVGSCADALSLFSPTALQAYLCYIKTFMPEMTRESEAIISRYYQVALAILIADLGVRFCPACLLRAC